MVGNNIQEIAGARALAGAAKETGLKHVVWPTLEDTRLWMPLDDNRMPTLMGKYKVPHFDGKGEGNHFFSDLGQPTTFLLTSFYADNLIHFGMGPKKTPDGKYGFTLPMGDKKLPGIAAEDIGKRAYGVFTGGVKYIGKNVGIAAEHMTGTQMADTLGRMSGTEVCYNSVTPEQYRGFGFPGADDLGNMPQFKRDFEADFCGARSIGASRTLNPDLQNFESWVTANKQRFPLD